MKTIIFSFIMFSSVGFAAEVCEDSKIISQETTEIKTDVPEYMKGATITVKLKDGRESTVPAEKFKVVPRIQQFIVSKIDTQSKCHMSEKNRLSLVAGKAPRNSLKTGKSSSATLVESEYGNTMGLQYQRDLGLSIFGLPLNVGAQIQDNDSGMGLIGVDF